MLTPHTQLTSAVRAVSRPIVHIMSGLPGSGKTTLAYQLLDAARGRMRRVNLDCLRDMLDRPGPGRPKLWSNAHEQMVQAVQAAAIREAVLGGWDLVLDDTNLTPAAPTRIKHAAGSLALFVVHDLTGVPIEECVRRDAGRPESVGADVIRVLAEQHAEAAATGWRLTEEWMNNTHDSAANGARYARDLQAKLEGATA